jgi:hypothetical protein
MKKENQKATIGKPAPAKPKTAEPAQYVMTPEDVDMLRPFVEDRTPLYSIENNALKVNHASAKVGAAKIAQAMGISDPELHTGVIQQLIQISSQGPKADAVGLNFAIAIVRSIAPRDHLEVLLAVQMAAVQIASIRHARMMNHTESIAQLDIQERVVNKLMRTFTTQMEAIRKHRNGGNQKVTVKHVHVHEGGQAIVGNVSHGGGSNSQKPRQSHEEREDDDLPLSVRAALHGNLQEDRQSVWVASGEVQDGMPFPWSKGGRS